MVVMRGLFFLSPTLRGLEIDAVSLGGVIGQASQLAESVSCKVRLLDQAKVSSYGGDVLAYG